MTDRLRNNIAFVLCLIITVSMMSPVMVCAASKAPAKPEISAAKAVNNTVQLSWKKAKNAKSYKVFVQTGSDGWKEWKTVKKTSKNKKKYSDTLKYKLKASGKKYMVYTRTNPYKAAKTVKVLNYTYTGKYNTTYSFVVQALNGDKTSKYSAVRTVTTPAQVFTVTFRNGITGETITAKNVEKGKSVAFPDAPVIDGYDFAGWDKDEPAVIRGNTVITANYKKKQEPVMESFTITFIDGYNNTTIEVQTVNKGDDAVLPEPPAHEGWTFKNWNSAAYLYVRAEATITAVYEKDPVIPDPVKMYSYSFIDSITGETISEGEIEEGGCITRPTAPAHDNYTFTGWDVSDSDMDNVKRNLVINTVYKNNAPGSYTVTFRNPVNGETIKSTVSEGGSASPPELPAVINTEKPNFKYYFEGWDSEDYMNVTHDVTINAVYSYEELFCITFYDEIDSLENEWDISDYYRSGTPIQSIPKPKLNSHDGYAFSYWEGDSEDALAGNIDMIARFSKAHTVTFRDAITQQSVRFDDNSFRISVADGGKVGKFPTPPEKARWQFNGWFKDTGMTQSFNAETDTITENTTLYAGYIRTFTADEETFIETYEGQTINIWALDNEYARGITVPETYPEAFDISTLVNEEWDIYVNDILINMNTYNVNDSLNNSTQLYNLIIDDGNLAGRYHYWEQTGQGVFCSRDSKYYDDLSYYVPENNIFKRYDYGTQTVKAVKGSREFTFYVNVNDYSDTWADEQVSAMMPLAFNEWIETYGGKSKTYKYRDENQEVISTITITTPTAVEEMSYHQKMTAISYYLTNHYDYSLFNNNDIYTLIDHAGDCWGNSRIICRAANILGLKSHVHMMDGTISRGHQIAAVDLGNNVVGIYDAGTANSSANSTGISAAPRPKGTAMQLPDGISVAPTSTDEEIPGYTRKGYTARLKAGNTTSLELTESGVYYVYNITDFDTFRSGTTTLPDSYSAYLYQYQDLDGSYVRGPVVTRKIYGITQNTRGFSPFKSIRLLSQLTNKSYIFDLLIKDNTNVDKIIIPDSYVSISDIADSDLKELNSEYTSGDTYTLDGSIEP